MFVGNFVWEKRRTVSKTQRMSYEVAERSTLLESATIDGVALVKTKVSRKSPTMLEKQFWSSAGLEPTYTQRNSLTT